MELVCEKYNELMESKDAQCAHPYDYCKFRTSCLIHMMGQERKFEKQKAGTVGQGQDNNSDKSSLKV